MRKLILISFFLGFYAPVKAETTKPKAPKSPSSKTFRIDSVEYASVAHIPLEDLELPISTKTESIKVLQGAASQLKVVDGAIRWLTPADPGQKSTVKLQVTAASGNTIVTVQIPTHRSTEMELDEHGPEEGGPPKKHIAPKLIVTGLGPGNILKPAEMRFRVEPSPKVELSASGGLLQSMNGDVIADLAKYWTYDKATNAMVIPLQRMKDLLAQIPGQIFIMQINLLDKAGSYAQVWNSFVYKPQASVQGQIVTAEGTPAKILRGRVVSLRGVDSEWGFTAIVDGEGSFMFPDVPIGNYNLELLDTDFPKFTMATASVTSSSKVVNVKLQYNQMAGNKKGGL
jgi:hypothetical protein